MGATRRTWSSFLWTRGTVTDVMTTELGQSPGTGSAPTVGRQAGNIVTDVMPTEPGQSPGTGSAPTVGRQAGNIVTDVMKTEPGHCSCNESMTAVSHNFTGT